MKRHNNNPTVKNEDELKECLGEYYTVAYANELIQKAKKRACKDKRQKEKNKKKAKKFLFN